MYFSKIVVLRESHHDVRKIRTILRSVTRRVQTRWRCTTPLRLAWFRVAANRLTGTRVSSVFLEAAMTSRATSSSKARRVSMCPAFAGLLVVRNICGQEIKSAPVRRRPRRSDHRDDGVRRYNGTVSRLWLGRVT